jgi:hypothetical protein
MSDWSRLEVEAIVSDYFAMLTAELRDEAYSKTAHRRALMPMLDGRSEGSIERKHQNISAVLLESGYPYIDGYKPLGNYQALLADVVETRLAADAGLARSVAEAVVQPAQLPSVEDILARLEAPPEPMIPRRGKVAERARRPAAPRPGVNYLEREAANASLGLAGELFALNFERARLVRSDRAALAERVEHVSIEVGDGLGYDIRSYEPDGTDRFIEVKTTAYGKETPFFVSRNEVAASRERDARFHLHRVFRFRRDPRIFTLAGAIERNCVLDAVQFSARVA